MKTRLFFAFLVLLALFTIVSCDQPQNLPKDIIVYDNGKLTINGNPVPDFIVYLKDGKVEKYARLNANNSDCAIRYNPENKGIILDTEEDAEIILLTQSGTSLEIHAQNASVTHFGEADSVNIVAVKDNSYHGNAQLQELTVCQGRVELNATVQDIVIAATGSVQLEVTAKAVVSGSLNVISQISTVPTVAIKASGTINTMTTSAPVSMEVAATASIKTVQVSSNLIISGSGSVAAVTVCVDNIELALSGSAKIGNLEASESVSKVTVSVTGSALLEGTTISQDKLETVTPDNPNDPNTPPTVIHQHTLQDHEGKEPTCTEPGYNAYKDCTECSYSTKSEKSPLGHAFGEAVVIKKATETEEGLSRKTCSRCEATKDEVIEKLKPQTPPTPTNPESQTSVSMAEAIKAVRNATPSMKKVSTEQENAMKRMVTHALSEALDSDLYNEFLALFIDTDALPPVPSFSTSNMHIEGTGVLELSIPTAVTVSGRRISDFTIVMDFSDQTTAVSYKEDGVLKTYGPTSEQIVLPSYLRDYSGILITNVISLDASASLTTPIDLTITDSITKATMNISASGSLSFGEKNLALDDSIVLELTATQPDVETTHLKAEITTAEGSIVDVDMTENASHVTLSNLSFAGEASFSILGTDFTVALSADDISMTVGDISMNSISAEKLNISAAIGKELSLEGSVSGIEIVIKESYKEEGHNVKRNFSVEDVTVEMKAFEDIEAYFNVSSFNLSEEEDHIYGNVETDTTEISMDILGIVRSGSNYVGLFQPLKQKDIVQTTYIDGNPIENRPEGSYSTLDENMTAVINGDSVDFRDFIDKMTDAVLSTLQGRV